MTIDSDSTGDPKHFRAFDELCNALTKLPPAPRDEGTLSLIVRKIEGGVRELPTAVRLTPTDGVPGDAWGRSHQPDPVAQLAVMQTPVASLIANGQPLELFGDNLYLDMDLSAANLPIGSRLRVGEALLEVTPQPHNGCKKFRARFGEPALRFVSDPDLRPRNLRGIYLRAIEAGEVNVGDSATVVHRP